jgi:hypothetical protein
MTMIKEPGTTGTGMKALKETVMVPRDFQM